MTTDYAAAEAAYRERTAGVETLIAAADTPRRDALLREWLAAVDEWQEAFTPPAGKPLAQQLSRDGLARYRDSINKAQAEMARFEVVVARCLEDARAELRRAQEQQG